MNDDLERRSDGYFGYPVLGIGTMVVAAVAMVIRLVSFLLSGSRLEMEET